MSSTMNSNASSQEHILARQRWLGMPVGFRVLVANDICRRVYQEQKTLKLEHPETKEHLGYVVTHKIESDPFEAKRAYSHLVTGMCTPQDFGVSPTHLYGMFKSYTENLAKGLEISVVAFVGHQKPIRAAV